MMGVETFEDWTWQGRFCQPCLFSLNATGAEQQTPPRRTPGKRGLIPARAMILGRTERRGADVRLAFRKEKSRGERRRERRVTPSLAGAVQNNAEASEGGIDLMSRYG